MSVTYLFISNLAPTPYDAVPRGYMAFLWCPSKARPLHPAVKASETPSDLLGLVTFRIVIGKLWDGTAAELEVFLGY